MLLFLFFFFFFLLARTPQKDALCLSVNRIRRHITINGDFKFDHLAKVVSAKFLHYKATVFLFEVHRYPLEKIFCLSLKDSVVVSLTIDDPVPNDLYSCACQIVIFLIPSLLAYLLVYVLIEGRILPHSFIHSFIHFYHYGLIALFYSI